MTKNELAEAIKQGIQQLGFARVPTPSVSEALAPGQDLSFDIVNALKEFSESHGWECQHAHQHLSNEVVFYPKGTPAPEL